MLELLREGTAPAAIVMGRADAILALGAIVARDDVMDWPPGSHASTFGGNPISCAAALATIKDVDLGGYFGTNISVENNKVGTGRVYQYSAESRLFTPTSDWLTV